MRNYIKIFLPVLFYFQITTVSSQWDVMTSGTTNNLNSVFFIDKNNGFAVGSGGTILKTVDGGISWALQPSGTANTLNTIFFVNASNGYAAGSSGTILKTIDGGVSWTLQPSGITAILFSVCFTDAGTGYACGLGGTILKTFDSGVSWTNLTSGTTNGLRSIYFPDPNNGFAVGFGGTILKTADGGISWTLQPSGTTGSLFSIFFPDPDTGYSTGTGGLILKTVDGGVSWSMQTSAVSNNLLSVFFTDGNNGFAVGSAGMILGTKNGGQNWVQQFTEGILQNLSAVHFATGTTGYAAGASGTIMKTINGGGGIFSHFIDVNNIKARINASGELFSDVPSSISFFEVPKGSGKTAIFASNFWIGGLDSSNQLHLAAQMYGQNGFDYFTGPVAGNYSDSLYMNTFKKIWKLDRENINYHRQNWNQPFYTMHLDIATWPATGNPANGEASRLAPYFDFNSNGIYDPDNGDYPLIRGNQAVYFIYNDDASLHTESNGSKLGIEIHAMVYGFDCPVNPALFNTIFINFEIINRSANNYDSVYTGIWVDFDLGNYSDDYIGCDTLLQSGFVYNGSSYDAVYGFAPPAVGVTFLNVPMNHGVYYNNDMTVWGNPAAPDDFYGYLKSLKKDDTPLPFRFMYPGEPDDLSQSSEVSAANIPGDRRYVISTGPFSLKTGGVKTIDAAYTFSRDLTGSNIGSVSLLKQNIQDIRAFFDNNSTPCGDPIHSDIILSVNKSDATCNSANGSAAVTITGGRPPYAYLWSNGSTAAAADSLKPGIYSVSITDSIGYGAFATVHINSAGGPAVSASVTNATCNGSENGALDVTLSGGSPPYTFFWSNGAATEDISGVPACSYDLLVKDGTGCVTAKEFTILQPSLFTLGTGLSAPSCGNTDGSLVVIPAGGIPPYSYQWSTGNTTPSITNVPAGFYSLTATDAGGCNITSMVALSDSGAPVAQITDVVYPHCGFNGNIYTGPVTGGTPPYTFLWNTGATTDSLTAIPAGEYGRVLTDLNGCKGVISFNLLDYPVAGDPICLVTVDSLTSNHVIVWKKSPPSGISNYNIYRLCDDGGYQLIKTIPYDSLNETILPMPDEIRHAAAYKISSVDTCGNETYLSQSHKTIYLDGKPTVDGKVLLSWNRYVGFPFPYYYIYRYSALTGWQVIDSVPNTENFYTDQFPPSGQVSYQVSSTHPGGCISGKAKKYNSSKSNTAVMEISVGISDIQKEEWITIYPNPNNGRFIIQFTTPVTGSIVIFNLLGEKIYVDGRSSTKTMIDLSEYSANIYFITLKNGDNAYHGKIIIHQ
ncbi:MAG: T9SS type A sorting domain-containing protein [Bacteroidetes bacterium]|nr:T9SS type A sorting domain-containing protein [Bacteroidota bacterium]